MYGSKDRATLRSSIGCTGDISVRSRHCLPERGFRPAVCRWTAGLRSRRSDISRSVKRMRSRARNCVSPAALIRCCRNGIFQGFAMKRSGLAIALLLVSNVVWASDYPSRSVTVVVAAAAGGPIDVLARIVAERMNPSLGQSVIVENMGGGGGIVGGQHVVHAAADGYTALLGTVATHANPQLFAATPPYNPQSDFEDVALIAQIPLILIARKDFPA